MCANAGLTTALARCKSRFFGMRLGGDRVSRSVRVGEAIALRQVVHRQSEILAIFYAIALRNSMIASY
jgi:hypothetical protein